MSTPITVAIVDDDALARSGIALALHDDDRLRIVAEGGDGSEVPELMRKNQPDVVLMDLRMPHIDGVDATAHISKHHPRTKVLVLSSLESDEAIAEALRVGAAGYVLKHESAHRLGQAIVDVFDGNFALSPSITTRFVRRFSSTHQPDEAVRLRNLQEELTPRELGIAEQVGEGLTNPEIAATLYLSVPTVKGHISTIMRKTGTTNRVQLALLVHRLRDRPQI